MTKARMTAGKIIAAALLSLVFSATSYGLDIKKKVLPSGLTVLHVEKHNLPLVMATMLVKASHVDEPEEKAGLANIALILLTQGTKTRTASEISEEMDFIGAGIGQSITSDYSTVSLSVLKKDIAKGFDVFSDVIVNPSFQEAEILRKKDLVKGSLKSHEEEPSYLAERAFKKAVYGAHPYGRHAEGLIETIDGISRDDIVKFHGDYYVPNNCVLAVVGDLTDAELDGLLDKYFGKWKKAEVRKKKYEIPQVKGKKVIKLQKDLTQATIYLGGLGVRRDNPDFYKISVMNYILGGGGFSSRLMNKIRDDLGLAYDVRSFFTSSLDKGLFQVSVQTKNASAGTVIKEIVGQMERIRTSQVSQSELEDSKAFLIGSFPGRIDTMRKIADFTVLLEFYGLGLDYMDKYPSYINSVTKEDVMEAAKKYTSLEDYVMTVVADQKKADIKE